MRCSDNTHDDLRFPATAIVMAGGQSRRMGADKGLLPIEGRPMIEHVLETLRPHFAQLIVSVADAGRYPFLDVEVVADRLRGQGPLMGIASALAASKHDLNFVQACDIPHTDLALVGRLLALATDCDAVIPRTPEGHYEPLFAVYRKGALAAMEEVLQSGRRKTSDIFGLCVTRFLDLGRGETIHNLNTRCEYEAHLRTRRSRTFGEECP
jgi:molybdopterin-guanine dinucleotide biosynthesis protein A